MVMRTKDSFRQPEKDLQHAKRSIDAGDFEWACFAAQQAAERAVKSLYQTIHDNALGHSVSRMLLDLPVSFRPQEDLLERAKELDKHYNPSRYPNFYPEGAPLDYYTGPEALRAVDGAEKILEFVRSLRKPLSVPRSVLRELQEHARHIQEIIATLEELADRKGIRGIRIGLKQYKQGEYVVVEDPKQLDSLLKGWRMAQGRCFSG